MKSDQHPSSPAPHIVWIFPGSLETTLSAATWLSTTNVLRKMGWRVTLAVSDFSGNRMIGGVEVSGFFSPEIYILRHAIYHLKIVWYILANWSGIDVVFFTQPTVPWMLPLILLRRMRRDHLPLMVMDTRTVPMEDLHTASMRDKLRGWLYDTMNMAANVWLDGQTAITKRMAEMVKIPPDRLWGIWPSGADVEEFVTALKSRHWPAEDEPVQLTYVGVLHYERNLMSLCKAVEMAHTEGMHFILSLTGEGTEKMDLEQFASQTAGRIQVNSPVPHDQVPEVLSRVHVGVLPFPDEEKYRVSSPVKLFEYMAAGLPILATKIVCHTDVIGDGKYVFWAEGASPEKLLDALRLIWKDRALLNQMGTEAAEAAQSWTWAEAARKLSAALLPRLQSENQFSQIHPIRTISLDK